MEWEQQPRFQLTTAYKYKNILGESNEWLIVDLEPRTESDSNWNQYQDEDANLMKVQNQKPYNFKDHGRY